MALPHIDTPLKIRVEKIKAPSKKAQKSLTEVVKPLRSTWKIKREPGKAQTFT